MVVACGQSQKHPGGSGGSSGEAATGGDPGSSTSAPLGGAGGVLVEEDGGSGSGQQAGSGANTDALGGAAGTNDEGAGAAADLAGAAGAGGAAAGAGGEAGAGGVSECADFPEIVLEAPLAITSFTSATPFDVTLGQGFQGEQLQLAQGQPLSAGCVTGQETNASLAVGIGGVEVAASGTPQLGAMRPQAPRLTRFSASPLLTLYEALLAEDASRSTWGYAAQSIRLWSYFLVQEQRSQVQSCGNGFVRSARPERAMVVALKLTFPTIDERELFGRCFSQGDPDITKLSDTKPISRFLVQHQAKLGLHVFSAAGPIPTIQQALADSQCSAADLPACAATLDALAELQRSLLTAPADTLPLASIKPAWGIFDFALGSYTLFPD